MSRGWATQGEQDSGYQSGRSTVLRPAPSRLALHIQDRCRSVRRDVGYPRPGDRRDNSPLEVKYDFGGERLAVSDLNDRLVAAAYNVHGVAAYTRDGDEVWRRNDLKRVQKIRLSACGDFDYCAIAGRSLAVLRVDSGESGSPPRSVARSLRRSDHLPNPGWRTARSSAACPGRTGPR